MLCYSIIRNWSLNQFPKNLKTEKPLWDSPDISKAAWGMAYDFLNKGQALILKAGIFFCVVKKIIKV